MQISENIKVSTGSSALRVDQRKALHLNDENLKAAKQWYEIQRVIENSL